MWRCPECGSSRLGQLRMPYGAMWCQDCGFRIEDKTAVPNPFYVPEEEEQPTPPQATEDRPGLGEQLYTWQQQMKRKKKK